MQDKTFLFKLSVMMLFLCVGTVQTTNAQKFVRGYAGGLYYLGDLAPLKSIYSLSSLNPGLGVAAGSELNETFHLHGKFTYGRLSGSDVDAKDDGRRERNLSFDSSLYELSIGVDIHFNKWWTGLDKYGLKLYYTTGLSLFHFNPKAFYNGRFVALQPLGTEGQGNENLTNKEKYSLTQLSVPFGFGIKFDLSTKVFMGFEVTPRWTFTDYIDDVSGEYIPFGELAASNGDLAAELANRTGEYLGTGSVVTQEGALRGDPNNSDWYLFTGVYIGYRWGVDEVEAESEESKVISDKLMF